MNSPGFVGAIGATGTVGAVKYKDIKPYDIFRVSIQSLNGEWASGYAEDLVDKSVEDGVDYCYAIASVDSSSVISEYNEFVYIYHKLKNLSTPTVAVKNTDNGIQVDWR